MKTNSFAWSLAALLVIAMACSPCASQETGSHDGTWKATLKGHKRDVDGEVVVTGRAGSWKFSNKSRNDPCIGLDAPIEVVRRSSEELVFRIARSKAIPQCNDNIAMLKPSSERALSGALDDGRKLTMVRQ